LNFLPTVCICGTIKQFLNCLFPPSGEIIIHQKKVMYNKTFLCITHTVEHNYMSLSSTVGIQLHVSALYVGHLQFVI